MPLPLECKPNSTIIYRQDKIPNISNTNIQLPKTAYAIHAVNHGCSRKLIMYHVKF